MNYSIRILGNVSGFSLENILFDNEMISKSFLPSFLTVCAISEFILINTAPEPLNFFSVVSEESFFAQANVHVSEYAMIKISFL